MTPPGIALRRLIDEANGHAIIFVILEGDDHALVEQMFLDPTLDARWYTPQRHPWSVLEALRAGLLLVTDLSWGPQAATVLRDLNRSRERLRSLGCTIIVAVHEQLAADVVTHARDLFEWRSGLLVYPGNETELGPGIALQQYVRPMAEGRLVVRVDEHWDGSIVRREQLPVQCWLVDDALARDPSAVILDLRGHDDPESLRYDLAVLVAESRVLRDRETEG